MIVRGPIASQPIRQLLPLFPFSHWTVRSAAWQIEIRACEPGIDGLFEIRSFLIKNKTMHLFKHTETVTMKYLYINNYLRDFKRLKRVLEKRKIITFIT